MRLIKLFLILTYVSMRLLMYFCLPFKRDVKDTNTKPLARWLKRGIAALTMRQFQVRVPLPNGRTCRCLLGYVKIGLHNMYLIY